MPDRLEDYRRKRRRRPHAGAVRRGASRRGAEPSLRGAAARGPSAPLRLPARAARHAPVLGRPEGALGRPRRQAHGRGGGGSPGRVRRLRGRHPGGQLRGRRRSSSGTAAGGGRWKIRTRAYERGKLVFELAGYKLRGEWALVRTRGSRRVAAPQAPRRLRRPGEPRPFAAGSVLSGRTLEEVAAGPRRDRRGPGAGGRARRATSRAHLADARAHAGRDGRGAVPRRGLALRAQVRRLSRCWPRRPGRTRRCASAPAATRPGASRRWRARWPRCRSTTPSSTASWWCSTPRAGPTSTACRRGPSCRGGSTWTRRRSSSRPPSSPSTCRPPPASTSARCRCWSARPAWRPSRRGSARSATRITSRRRARPLFREAVARGLEGIVAKRADAPYRAGRSRSWLKVRGVRTADLAVVGFTAPAGGRTGFGALHLAASGAGGAGLRRPGRLAGSTRRPCERWPPAWRPGSARRPRCGGAVPGEATDRWVEPELVAEVRFASWTRDGLLRQPVFVRLREDKTLGGDRRRAGVEGPAAPASGRSRAGARPGGALAAGEGLLPARRDHQG